MPCTVRGELTRSWVSGGQVPAGQGTLEVEGKTKVLGLLGHQGNFSDEVIPGLGLKGWQISFLGLLYRNTMDWVV